MACQHAAEHHEIRAAAEGFRDIAWHGAATVADDLAAQTVRSVSAFNYRRQLRITHTGFHARGANGARANAHFHNVGSGEDQLFTHFTGHHVARDDGFGWPGFTRLADELDEMFGITICHVNADKIQRRIGVQDLFGFLEICIRRTGRDHHMLHHFSRGGGDKRIPLFSAVVFVYRSKDVELRQCGRHLEGPDGVHVGRDNRHARPRLTGMLKGELTFEFNV